MLLAEVHDLVPGTALALGLVHGGVGVLQELLGELSLAGPEKAMPTLAVIVTGPAESTNGAANASPMRAAIASTSAGLVQVLAQDDELVARQPGQGVPRPQERRSAAAATAIEQLVADVVAVRSFTDLNRSRSAKRTAASLPDRRPRSTAWSRRSSSRIRLGSPVSGVVQRASRGTGRTTP